MQHRTELPRPTSTPPTTQHLEHGPSRPAIVVRRHPVPIYFALTYVATWMLWAPLVLAGESLPAAVSFVLAMLGSLVPSTVALVLVALVNRRPGVRALLGRLLMGRFGLRWYAAVLAVTLLGPLALGLSILLGGVRPDLDITLIGAVGFFFFSIFPGSAVGEEIGWRGFALPRLQARDSALRAALVIGVVWGCWHLPLWLTGTESHPLRLFVPFVVSVVAMSVLCTWMYNSTGGSLLIVVLLHAAANLPLTLLITPLGGDMTQPFLIFVGLMVLAAATVVGLTGPAHLSRTRTKQVSVP
jgi:uncharacterized protein